MFIVLKRYLNQTVILQAGWWKLLLWVCVEWYRENVFAYVYVMYKVMLTIINTTLIGKLVIKSKIKIN